MQEREGALVGGGGVLLSIYKKITRSACAIARNLFFKCKFYGEIEAAFYTEIIEAR